MTTVPGDLFTAGGVTLRKTVLTSVEGRANGRTWAEDPVTGARRDLTREEGKAFWTWAAVEVLRSTRGFSGGPDQDELDVATVPAGQRLIKTG